MKSRKIITVHDVFMFFYLFPLRKLAAILPARVTYLISIPLSYIYSFLPVSHERRVAVTKTMNLVFGNKKAQKDIRTLSQQCLRNFFRTFMGDLALDRLSKKDVVERGVIIGREHLENALLDKKGVLLVGGHFSGDRIAKRFLREIGFPVMSVRTKSPVDPAMSMISKKFFFPVMSSSLNDVLKDCVFIEDKGFSIEILKRLRNNGLVSILFDAKGRAAQGIHCPFFGSQRFFPTSFLEIAQLTGAAVIPMLCIGNSASFTITLEERIELQQFSDKKEFISANINTLVKIFELQLSRYPTHWLLRK